MKKSGKTKTSNKNNTLLIAGVIAVLFSIVVYGILISAENSVLGKYDRTRVYVVASEEGIGSGTQVTESDFVMQQMDTALVPANAITNLSEIENTFALYPLAQNTVITKEMFHDIDTELNGDKEIGISVSSLAGAVNGILRSSDYIDIYILAENKDGQTYNATDTTYVANDEVIPESEYQQKYKTETVTTQEEVPVLDEEGNPTYDEEGNPVTELKDVESEVQVPVDDAQYSIFDEPANEQSETVDDSKNIVGNVTPAYTHVYITKAFDSAGVRIPNNDTETVAQNFNITLPEEDANILIEALQKGLVYITLNRDGDYEKAQEVKAGIENGTITVNTVSANDIEDTDEKENK